MAFLSAGVASANVSARGRAVIWRMSHEMLLNYVENCKGGSQLVLNIAASLSGRVQGETGDYWMSLIVWVLKY